MKSDSSKQEGVIKAISICASRKKHHHNCCVFIFIFFAPTKFMNMQSVQGEDREKVRLNQKHGPLK